jgi:hypothetical protein
VRPVPTGRQVVQIADRIRHRNGASAAAMAITAAFTGMRHHKTMLDELDVPEVLVCERMGHRMKGIGGRYSHVTQAMRHRRTGALQRRWTTLAKITR